MLRDPSKNDAPLKDSLKEAINVTSQDAIPKYVRHSLDKIKAEAERLTREHKAKIEDMKILFDDSEYSENEWLESDE